MRKKYLLSTLKHKWYVILASRKVGLPLWRALVHDLSKFLPVEFPHNARKYFGGNPDPAGYLQAWLYHQNHNPHHWSYWILGSQSGIGSDLVLPMPEIYVREMVADWMGMEMINTGSWNMSKWLRASLPVFVLNPATVQLLQHVLGELGYTENYWGADGG
jgi:hypothetical protein